jgi:N-acyl-D-aspartate/D-glutamate deacylase
MDRAGRGVFEMIPAGTVGELKILGGERHTLSDEVDLLDRVARTSGRPVTFTLVQNDESPTLWRDMLDKVDAANADAARLFPQVASRPIGLVTNIQAYHLFERRPTYMAIAALPLAQRLSEMRKAEVRSAILGEPDIRTGRKGMSANAYQLFQGKARRMFALDHPIDYEPAADQSFAARAEAAGQSYEEFMYDFLIGNDGNNFAIALGSNYHDRNLDALYDMLTHKDTISGLSDAGAHVNMIFDGVAPTYQMIHWSRDRTRGALIPLEKVIAKASKRNANLYDMHDRGSIEIGKRADINVIDFDRLSLGALEVRNDLPAGGSRILQPASGYLATYVAGVMTRQNDRDTGARPGRLYRSGVN